MSEDIELENESLTDMTVDNNNYSIFHDINNEDIPNILNIETSIISRTTNKSI